MGIQLIGGTSGAVADVGVAAANAVHVAAKPIPYGTLGHYRVARRFVPIASATANTNFVAFRNATANLCILTRLALRIRQIGAPTAAIDHRIGAIIARGYTVADGTGIGTTLTMSGNNSKKRTSMATPGAVITETSAAGGLTGGTKTLDSDPFALHSLWVLAAVPTAGPSPDMEVDWEPSMADGSHPVVLAQNEGFVLQNLAALGAASGVVIQYEIAWAEVTTF